MCGSAWGCRSCPRQGGAVERSVDSAWFQRLKLEYDQQSGWCQRWKRFKINLNELHPSYAFNFNLRTYTKGIVAGNSSVAKLAEAGWLLRTSANRR